MFYAKYLPLIRSCFSRHHPIPFYFFIIIAIILMLCGAVVFMTGGTHQPFTHLMYLPILLAGTIYGIRGGLLAAIVATFILGPFMPLNSITYEYQLLSFWLLRGVFFLMIGALSGFTSGIYRIYYESLEQKYLIDPLTDLPNFMGLNKIFDEFVHQKSAPTMAIFVIEVSNLREIEQGVGPIGSQQLLQEIARHLRAIVGSRGFVAHTDTADFVVIVSDASLADDFYEECQRTLPKTYTINNVPLFAELFYGLAVYPQDGHTLPDLQRKVKSTIQPHAHRVKQLIRYEKEANSDASHNLQILHDLHNALEQKELTLFYQPIVDLKRNRLIGAEALVRWQINENHMRLPKDFLPLADRTLLINPLAKWVIAQATKDLRDWIDRGLETTISLNVSMKNFHDETVLKSLFSHLTRHQLDPHLIKLEVTESSVTPNMEEVIRILRSLREKGIEIAIDDFGTGNASEQYLFELPLDYLKVDQIFVRAMRTNPAAHAIVNSAITLAHELNLKVIAEGIEAKEEAHELKTMGCDMGQGYFFATPLPKEAFIGWRQSHNFVK